MKLLRGALVAWLLSVPGTAFAQQSAIPPDQADRNRVRTAAPAPPPTSRKPAFQASLQSPMLTTPNLPPWIALTPTTFGFFTFVTPETQGEFIRVSVPVGDLTMRAVRAIGGLERRRAEQAARREVAHAIEAVQVAAPNQPVASKR